MGEHDQNHKRLLRTFFREFLAAFAVDLYRDLDNRAIEFWDKELIRPGEKADRMKVADLVARVRLKGMPGYILVHVEHQSRREKNLGLRLLSYAVGLMEQTGLPVYPILVTSYDRPMSAEPDTYVVELQGRRILDFRYRVIQLNRLNWKDYLKARNPAATALMSEMKIEPKDRPKVKAQILRLILTMRLSPAKMGLIAGFADRYLSLSAKEELAMRRELDNVLTVQEKEVAMSLMTVWERRGLEKGLEQGIEKGIEKGLEKGREVGREEGRMEERIFLVRRLLQQRFGRLPTTIPRRVSRLNGSQLEALAVAVLSFRTILDLRRWLAATETPRRRAA